MKVLVIGAGNMGLTYAEDMAASPYLNRRKLMVFDVSEDRAKLLTEILKSSFLALGSVSKNNPGTWL